LAGEVQLDCTEFTHLATTAAYKAENGELGRAERLYERSLRIWRGDVLADLDLSSDLPAVAEIGNRRDEVVWKYASIALLMDAPERALPHLRTLCDREPYDESAHAALIKALALAAGRLRPSGSWRIFSLVSTRNWAYAPAGS
jgi:DNA-binding SARP family transcriptional activator